MGGLGWCGGVKHLVGLWGPGGLTGLAGLRVDSSERGSAMLEGSVLPFWWRSAISSINSFHLFQSNDNRSRMLQLTIFMSWINK